MQDNERRSDDRADLGLLLGIAEAAKLLGISRMTITRRIKDGTWPSGRCGRKHLIPRTFVLGAIAAVETGRQVNVDDFAAEWFAKVSEGVA
jgi:excisionase family DNA binding protein